MAKAINIVDFPVPAPGLRNMKGCYCMSLRLSYYNAEGLTPTRVSALVNRESMG
jgi:hypothetical protein